MENKNGLRTPYEDCVPGYQNPKESDGTSFGEPVIEGGPPAESGGEWGKGVQFADVKGAGVGAVGFAKIPGSGGQNN